MKNHLGSCRRILHGCGDGTQTKLVLPLGGRGTLGTWTFNQDVIRKGVAEMIIIDELPFRFVEWKRFRHCMSLACPRFHMLSGWTVARDCYEIYSSEKKSLR